MFFLSSFSWSFFAWRDSVAIVSFSKKFAHLISLCLLPGVLFKTCFGIWRRFDSLSHWPAYEALTKRWESLHLELFSISVGSLCNISELWPLVSSFFRQSSFPRLAPVCSYNSVVCFVLFLSSHGHKEWNFHIHYKSVRGRVWRNAVAPQVMFICTVDPTCVQGFGKQFWKNQIEWEGEMSTITVPQYLNLQQDCSALRQAFRGMHYSQFCVVFSS